MLRVPKGTSHEGPLHMRTPCIDNFPRLAYHWGGHCKRSTIRSSAIPALKLFDVWVRIFFNFCFYNLHIFTTIACCCLVRVFLLLTSNVDVKTFDCTFPNWFRLCFTIFSYAEWQRQTAIVIEWMNGQMNAWEWPSGADRWMNYRIYILRMKSPPPRGSSPGVHTPVGTRVSFVRHWQSGKDLGSYSTSHRMRTWCILAQVIPVIFAASHSVHRWHT